MESGWNVWVWCVASGCGEQEAGVASWSGWNLRVWQLGVVVRRSTGCGCNEVYSY